MLAAVGQGPELGKPEEATVALDRVDGAKNARQPLRVAGGLFERKEIPVELIEVFTRLDEKFLDEFTVVVHSSPQAYPVKPAQGGESGATGAALSGTQPAGSNSAYLLWSCN